jgi:hypothetical protein
MILSASGGVSPERALAALYRQGPQAPPLTLMRSRREFALVLV